MKRAISLVTAFCAVLLLALLTTGVGLTAVPAPQNPLQPPVDKFVKTVLPGSQLYPGGTIHYQVELHLTSTAFGDVVMQDDFLYGIDFQPFGGADGNFKINGVPVTLASGTDPDPKFVSSILTRNTWAFYLGTDLAPGTAIITFDAKVSPTANIYQPVVDSATLFVGGKWKAASKVSSKLSAAP